MSKHKLKSWRHRLDQSNQDSQLLGEFIQALEEISPTMDDLLLAGFTKTKIRQAKAEMERLKLDPDRPKDVVMMVSMMIAGRDRKYPSRNPG